jgi:hypothetical protein
MHPQESAFWLLAQLVEGTLYDGTYSPNLVGCQVCAALLYLLPFPSELLCRPPTGVRTIHTWSTNGKSTSTKPAKEACGLNKHLVIHGVSCGLLPHQVEMRALEDLMSTKLPRLAAHMAALEADVSIIATDWCARFDLAWLHVEASPRRQPRMRTSLAEAGLDERCIQHMRHAAACSRRYLSLFASSMPSESAARVWDALMNEGPKVRWAAAGSAQVSPRFSQSPVSAASLQACLTGEP